VILDLWFPPPTFSVVQLSGMSRAEYCELSNVSTKNVVTILRVNICCFVSLGRLMWGREWTKRWISSNTSNAPPHFLPYIRRPKSTNQYIFTLRMATAMFAETLDISKYSARLIPESRNFRQCYTGPISITILDEVVNKLSLPCLESNL
jgi:hypothetical protein